MISANNSPDNPSRNGKQKKRKKTKLEKSVKKEGRKSLRKVLKGKAKGHFIPNKKGDDDSESRSLRKSLKNQQNIATKSTNPKQEAAINAALESMKPPKKPFMASGSSRSTKWLFNKKKKKYRPVKGN